MLPESIDYELVRIATSDQFRCGLHTLLREWTWPMLVQAHAVLDAFDASRQRA